MQPLRVDWHRQFHEEGFEPPWKQSVQGHMLYLAARKKFRLCAASSAASVAVGAASLALGYLSLCILFATLGTLLALETVWFAQEARKHRLKVAEMTQHLTGGIKIIETETVEEEKDKE